ncbi:MAG: transporter, partial [Phycisphaerae bacterium]|nr:transporter [Phycisphaerae bacterium]
MKRAQSLLPLFALLAFLAPSAAADTTDLLSASRLDPRDALVLTAAPPPSDLLLSEWQFVAAPTDEGRAISEGGAPAPHHHHFAGGHAGSHAPIGVMGDHLHDQGEWMLSYRFMKMKMDGLRNGDSRISAGDVLAAGFPVTPVDMATEMHMWGLMYAPSDELTLMGMMSYVRKRMNHITGMGGAFKTNSEGIGDTRLTALVDWYHDDHHHVHLNLGLSVPSGSISRQDTTPAGFVRLPYPMQLGSGTWDLMPGITYNGHNG